MSNTIGHKGGSRPINATSINRGQAKGGPVSGYGKPSVKIGGSAADRIAPQAGAANGMKNQK